MKIKSTIQDNFIVKTRYGNDTFPFRSIATYAKANNLILGEYGEEFNLLKLNGDIAYTLKSRFETWKKLKEYLGEI